MQLSSNIPYRAGVQYLRRMARDGVKIGPAGRPLEALHHHVKVHIVICAARTTIQRAISSCVKREGSTAFLLATTLRALRLLLRRHLVLWRVRGRANSRRPVSEAQQALLMRALDHQPLQLRQREGKFSMDNPGPRRNARADTLEVLGLRLGANVNTTGLLSATFP